MSGLKLCVNVIIVDILLTSGVLKVVLEALVVEDVIKWTPKFQIN